MTKIILTDIKSLQINHVQNALQALKRQGDTPPYKCRLGFGVKLGPGVETYMKDKEVVME